MADENNNSNPTPGDGIDINEMSAMLEGIMLKDDTNIGEELNNSMDLYWGKRAPLYKLLEKSLHNVGGGNPPNSPRNPVNNAIPKENPIDKENRLGMRRLFKTKFFDNVLKGLKGIIASAGSILMDFLEFFLFMAFIDPSGSLLKSLIMIFFKIFTMVIGIIIKLLPKAIKMMVETFSFVIKLIVKAIPSLADALMKAFDTLIAQYPGLRNTFEAFKGFFSDIKNMFTLFNDPVNKMSISSLIYEFAKSVFTRAFELLGGIVKDLFLSQFTTPEMTEGVMKMADNIAGLVKGLVGAGLVIYGLIKIYKAYRAIMLVVVTIQRAYNIATRAGGILTKLQAGFQALYNLVMSANPIMLVVIAVIAFFAMLWLFRDEIASFFEGIWNSIKSLWNTAGPILKLFMVAIGILFYPIVAVGLAIYGLVKLFQSFAEIGIEATFQKIFDWFKIDLPKIFSQAWDDFTGWLGGLFGGTNKAVETQAKSTSAVDSVVVWLDGIQNSFVESVMKFTDVFFDFIEKGLPKIRKKFFDRLGKIFGVDLNKLYDNWKQKISDFLKKVGETFSITKIIDKMGNVGTTIKNQILNSGVGRFFSNLVEDLTQKVKSWIGLGGNAENRSFGIRSDFEDESFTKLATLLKTKNVGDADIKGLTSTDEKVRNEAIKTASNKGNLNLEELTKFISNLNNSREDGEEEFKKSSARIVDALKNIKPDSTMNITPLIPPRIREQ